VGDESLNGASEVRLQELDGAQGIIAGKRDEVGLVFHLDCQENEAIVNIVWKDILEDSLNRERLIEDGISFLSVRSRSNGENQNKDDEYTKQSHGAYFSKTPRL